MYTSLVCTKNNNNKKKRTQLKPLAWVGAWFINLLSLSNRFKKKTTKFLPVRLVIPITTKFEFKRIDSYRWVPLIGVRVRRSSPDQSTSSSRFSWAAPYQSSHTP